MLLSTVTARVRWNSIQPLVNSYKIVNRGTKRCIESISSDQEVYIKQLLEKDAGISIIKLNRPKAANSLGKVLMSQLNDILRSLKEEDPNKVRCVIIASDTPGVFCAGADLRERATMSDDEALACVHNLRNTFEIVSNLPMPVIASIEGAAYGGGLELALAADIRVASKSSMLGLIECSVGVIPGAGGTVRLPRLIPPSRAKELIFTAQRISAAEALQLGIIDHLVDDTKSKALEIARRIVANAPLSVRASKSAIQQGMSVSSVADALLIEGQNYAKIIPTNDRLEGMAAFREKRKPVYRGD